jgi:hypothetical protein
LAGEAGASIESATEATESEGFDAASGGQGVAKDGSTAPLEAEEGEVVGGGETPIATSPQDAQAQQDAPRDDPALERARAALDAGDEQACLDALEEARG